MSFSCVYDYGKWLSALLSTVCGVVWLPLLGQVPSGSLRISGTVATLNGSPLVGAHVILRANSGSMQPRQAETDKAGQYSFSGLSPGAYTLNASASGFRDSEPKIVFLTSATASSDLILTPLEPGGKASTVGGAIAKSPPTFSPVGVRGTIAPSGYSSGLNNEETAHVRASANLLQTALFDKLTAGAPVDCSQEPVLLQEVEKSPHDFASNHALGTFYLSHRDYGKAIQYLAAARALVPGDFNNSLDLAAAMIGDSRGSDAAVFLEQLLRDHVSDSSLLRLLAFAYKFAGDNEKSVAAFRKAAASDAGVENQYDCGVGLIQLGALSQALEIFTEATKAHSESARLWLGLGIAEHLLDHKQEAVAALLRSADGDPHFLSPLALLAELSILSDQAKADLRRRVSAYLVTHPEDPEAHFTYALALSKQTPANDSSNSRQEITSQLQRALQLNPRIARAHFLLSDIESRANNLPGAIDELVEGLKLEPGNRSAHYRLALLYRRLGQPDNASKEMDSFRLLNGTHGDETSPDATAALSLTMPSIQPISAQRGCGVKPE